MAMIEILQYPDPRLRIKARIVTDFNDPELQKIIDDMFETLYNTENCAGLAATQLAIPNPPRVTVIDVSSEHNQPLCLINPEILAREGEVALPEGCMSVHPDHVHETVRRAPRIKAKAYDRHGKEFTFEAEGLLAKCVQHEIDHLNGKLYIDHLSTLKRHLVETKIKKILRHKG